MQRCGAEDDGRVCRLPATRHSHHMDAAGVSWENEIESARPEVRSRRTTLTDLARGAQPATTARLDRSHETGVPAQAQAAWERDKDAWLSHAYAVLVETARRETGGWTTPEAVWPSLRRPPGDHEMRALSVVVQRALRAGVIVEVGAVRLRGTYTTADGFTFAMNKIVPVYGRPGSTPALSS